MLHEGTLTLRAYRDDDIDALAAMRNDVELQQFLLARPRPNATDDVRGWLRRRSSEPDTVFFVVEFEGRFAGFLQFMAIDTLHRRCASGCAMVPEVRGHGLFRRVYHLAAPYLRDVFGVQKIKCDVLASNASSIRALEKTGFDRAGLLRRELYIGGTFVDIALMEWHIP